MQQNKNRHIKKTISIIVLIISIVFSVNAQSSVNVKQAADNNSDLKYSPLSKELFDKIQTKMEEQESWIPIKLEGFSKKELVTFYLQSYNDKIISTWVDFSYKKMNNFKLIKENSIQDNEFKRILKLPRNFDNAFKFMMLMDKNQIETVGY